MFGDVGRSVFGIACGPHMVPGKAPDGARWGLVGVTDCAAAIRPVVRIRCAGTASVV